MNKKRDYYAAARKQSHTCSLRNQALFELRAWIEAKGSRENIRIAEIKLMKAARQYFGLF